MASLRTIFVLLAAVAAPARAASPVAGFRPPAVPLLTNSPICNSWSASDHLYDAQPVHWTGWNDEMVSIVRVDGVPYMMMGTLDSTPNITNISNAVQTGLSVYSTQTVYTFTAGAVHVTLTFTSPLLTEDWELLSRPMHFITYQVVATDGAQHSVQLYFDVSGRLVANDGNTNMVWRRTPVTGFGLGSQVTALSIGSENQLPLSSTDDRLSWGNVYLLAETDPTGAHASLVLEYGNITRAAFLSSGSIPSSDNIAQPAPLISYASYGPGTGPQIGTDRPGNDLPGYPITLPKADYNLCWALCNQTAACAAWAYAVQGNGCQPNTPQCWLKGSIPATVDASCRVSGAQYQVFGAGVSVAAATVFDLGPVGAAPVSRFVAIAIDELQTINWFGEVLPPYWRRNLNDTTSVPMEMLASGFASYEATIQACNVFDAKTAAMLSAVGGDHYATIAQLTYRQVFGDMQLVWVPSKQAAWYFVKEVSSCGCLQTADVVYPAFAQVLFHSPELMRLMLVPLLEYAMNFTSERYPLPWSPHHLGYWPLANLPYTSQENMPLEETAWQLLQIASIAQLQGGDMTWLQPYWPVITQWYDFLVTLLPFPGTQLSTDDFDGPIANATNLAMKGVAAIAAFGYIVQQYTGNATAAAAAYATAASYAATMVQYSWVVNGSDSHFMLGYMGSQGDSGETSSWAMMYNALWLRLLGYDNLLPSQDAYLSAQRDWYAANVMHTYGLPLNSRKTFTKDDWMTFTAALFYDNSSTPQPSAFSNTLFDRFFAFANTTTSREPLSDWTDTDDLSAVGFANRPVYGAMYTPVLVALGQQMGLGDRTHPANVLARETFARVHAELAAAKHAQQA